MRRLVGAVSAVVMAVALVTLMPTQATGATAGLVPVSPSVWPAVIDPTLLDSITVRATGLGSQPGTLRLNGPVPREAQTVVDNEVVTIDVAGLPDGEYGLVLRGCDQLDNCWSQTRPLHVRRQPILSVGGTDLLLNQNGDGLWESASPRVRLDPEVAVAARWSIKAGTRLVAGPFDMTPEQIARSRAERWGAGVVVDEQTLGKRLPAGDYWFEVQATATEPDFTKSAVARTAIYISHAPPLTKLKPVAPVFYPHDIQLPRVPRVPELSPRLDRRILEQGNISYEVLDADDEVLGHLMADSSFPAIRWNGYYQSRTGVSAFAPPAIYRLRVHASDNEGDVKFVRTSAPFRLSHHYRDRVQRVTTRRAASTRTRTLAQDAGSVHAKGGSLHYRSALGKRVALVRTAHRIRVPSDALGSPTLRIRGAWKYGSAIDVEIVTPKGRIIDIDYYGAFSSRRADVLVRPRWIHPDGTVRFRVVWSGARAGRVDTVGIVRLVHRWRK